MACTCNNENYTYLTVTGATIIPASTSPVAPATLRLSITGGGTITLTDGDKYKLLIPNNVILPTGIENMPVTLGIGDVITPLWAAGSARPLLGADLISFTPNCPMFQTSIPAEYVNVGTTPYNMPHFTAIKRKKRTNTGYYAPIPMTIR